MPQINFDPDLELESCVRELLRNSREDYSDVHVTVDACNVKFSGTLDSESARKHLAELAEMVQGIGSVTNEVTLKR
ncbi:MAG: BON domain-containing protein [Bacteriovoracaceae bacterium]